MSDSMSKSSQTPVVILGVVIAAVTGICIFTAISQRHLVENLDKLTAEQSKIQIEMQKLSAGMESEKTGLVAQSRQVASVSESLDTIAKNQRAMNATLSNEIKAIGTAVESQKGILDTVSHMEAGVTAKLDAGVKNQREDAATLSREMKTLSTMVENQKGVLDAVSRQRTGVVEQLGVILKGQQEASNHVEQQTAVLHRALGNVLPIKMPPNWESHLAELEAQVAATNRWPKDPTEAKHFLDQTSALVKVLPPWAEADYLARLNAVRWGAMALVSLNPPKETVQSAEQLNNLISAKPDSGSSELEHRLGEEAKRLVKQDEVENLTKTYHRVQKYLNAEPNASPSDADTNILSDYETLGHYERDAEIQTLRKTLHERIVIRQVEQQSAAMKGRWTAAKELSGRQSTLYEAAAAMLLNEVVSARLTLALEGIKQTAYDSLENELRTTVTEISLQAAKRDEERQSQSIRKYQRWALSELKAFENVCVAIEKKHNKAGKDSWNPWTKVMGIDWDNDDFLLLCKAMESHLLPINIALLDMPVQERYQREFQRGWKQLEGKEEQTIVAERTAEIVKKTLREFSESQK